MSFTHPKVLHLRVCFFMHYTGLIQVIAKNHCVIRYYCSIFYRLLDFPNRMEL